MRIEGYVFSSQLPGTVPLKLYWSSERSDNFITATEKGEQDAIAAGYQFARVEGYVYPQENDLRLFWSNLREDNFTTATKQGESDAFAAKYNFVRNEGLVFSVQAAETVPLKLYWNAQRGDNFSTSTAEGENTAISEGYRFARIDGYVFTNQQPGAMPLKLFWHPGRQDYFTTATVIGENSAIAAGYEFRRIEGYVFPNYRRATDRRIDLTISVYRQVNGNDRPAYENIIGFFADAIYEMSNGAQKIRSVTIFQNGEQANTAHVRWNASEWPNADVTGYDKSGWQVRIGDVFPFSLNNPYNALQQANWCGAGYALAHEWGHYFYGLYDEYDIPNDNFNDVPVQDSIMTEQWRACRNPPELNWLNFSIARSNTQQNEQHRRYGASGWETLARPPWLDPRDGNRRANPVRTFYPELGAVAPIGDQFPTFELPVSQSTARNELNIVWIAPGTSQARTSQQDASQFSASITSIDGSVINYPEPVILVADVKKNDRVAKAGLASSMKTPDGATKVLPLKDDGVSPDVTANDGLYSGLMPYSIGGLHVVTATFDNNSGQAEFTQISYHTIGPNGETFVPRTFPVGESFSTVVTTTIVINNFPLSQDDHGDTSQTATLLLSNNLDTPGRIDHAGDKDVFKATPSISETLILRMTNLALGMHPNVRVLKDDGTVIKQVSLLANTDNYLYFSLDVKAGEIYFMEVSHVDPNAQTGFYAISIGQPLASEKALNTVYLPTILR